ncbi:hypothetical protein LDENG_00101320 [Lucifuga dentata]|nr:hypothetical protein LDENG_00101320 [Lucifuga dentata]
MFGQKTSGKSATGNILLHKEVFATCQNDFCLTDVGEVAGRRVTVTDTPGWTKNSSGCTEEMDTEIVRGLSFYPAGVHAVLLVVPLDVSFREVQQVAMEEHMNLFDASIWKHTIVLFTYGDRLADKSVEEHIEREPDVLRQLVEWCENRYHVLNNKKKSDMSQVTDLFEKIEEMVAGNDGRLFCPDMNEIHQRIDEKFRRMELVQVFNQRLEKEYRRRELELMKGFRQTLVDLQNEIQGSATPMKYKLRVPEMPKIKPKATGQWKKDGKEKEENLETKISQEIEKLDEKILRLTNLLQGSMDILLPNFSKERPEPSLPGSSSDKKKSSSTFENILDWLAMLQMGTNTENQVTFNFSQTSGYRSVTSLFSDFHRREDLENA